MAKRLAPGIYESLLNRLINLFPGPPRGMSLTTVANQATLDTSKINFIADAYSVWDAMLTRAELEEKVELLLKAAQHFFKNDDLVNSTLASGDIYLAAPVVTAAKRGVLKEQGKLRIFINYNSADAASKEKLINFTKPYIRFPQKLPVEFFDVIDDILAGSDKQQKAKEELERSDVALLLLSNDFLIRDDGFCYDLTLAAQELGKVLAPVKLRAAPLERITQISPLKMLPYDQQPLANRDDDAYDNVAREIYKLIDSLLKQ